MNASKYRPDSELIETNTNKFIEWLEYLTSGVYCNDDSYFNQIDYNSNEIHHRLILGVSPVFRDAQLKRFHNHCTCSDSRSGKATHYQHPSQRFHSQRAHIMMKCTPNQTATCLE